MALTGSCTSGQPLGTECDESSECSSELQCLNAVCVPRCEADIECGEGFLCLSKGECEEVISPLGSSCRREQDCGPGLACVLELQEDRDEDGFLDGACFKEFEGSTTGNDCNADHDCRNGICITGLCTQLCLDTRDCPTLFECAIILDSTTAKKFRGCYPGETP